MIAYKTFGDINNPKMLLAHGFMGNLNDWNHIVDHFSKNYFCIAIDLPGHGSTLNSNNNDFFEKLNKLYDLYKPEVIIGYSMGGRLLLESLLLHSNYSPKFLVLESVNPGIKDIKLKSNRVKSDLELFNNSDNKNEVSFFEKWFSMPIFGNLKSHKFFDDLITKRSKDYEQMKASWQESINTWGPGMRPNLWVELNNLKSKTIYIAGDEDIKYSKIANEIKANSVIKTQFIAKSGHNTHLQQKDSYIKTIDHFLRH